MATGTNRDVGLYAYSLHGRSHGVIIDYVAFFSELAGVEPVLRQTGVGDETVAITALSALGDDRWAVRFVSGHDGLPPLFYDPVTGTESTAELGSSFVANASWLFADARKRVLVADRSRPGVAVGVMARALSHLGSELEIAPELVIDLNPIPGAGFLQELERFGRIRQASVVLARPNYNWLKSSNQLSGYADDSNAGTVDVVMSAGRGQSLSKSGGIIADIAALASRSIGPLKNLRVTGTRTGESKETTISLEKHQERRFVQIPVSASPAERRGMLEEAALTLMDEVSVSADLDDNDR